MRLIFSMTLTIYLLNPCIINANALGKEAYSHIRNIVMFGTRVPGTKGNIDTQNYIKKIAQQNQLKVSQVMFNAKTPLGTKKMTNIWATYYLPRSSKSKIKPSLLVFAAHYDSKYFKEGNFLGVDDSLSGVGVLLSMMPLLKDLKLNQTEVIFLFLDGEEALKDWSEKDSLYGSRYQAQYWEKNNILPSIQALIVLDMVGGKDVQFCQEMNSQRLLTESVFLIGNKLGYQDMFSLNCRISVEDDHIPFGKKGVPVLDLIPGRFPSYWHTDNDHINNMDPNSLEKVGKTLMTFIKAKNR